MFKMLIIAAAFVGGLLYFGVLDDAGEIVTEMLPKRLLAEPSFIYIY